MGGAFGQEFATNDPILLNAYLKDIQDPACGATVLFSGITRNHNNGKEYLEIPPACEKK
jgi:molybdopterin synthase catalytic subunit